MLSTFIRFFLENKLVSWLLILLFIGWGLISAPFDYNLEGLPRNPVSVDALPDIGENQQIVFTKWQGQSPQDIEDQITYPLTTALLGIPGVKNIRSNSIFGFSSIYVIFNDDVEFYWSRSRILEKLNSLPSNILPDGVQPTLGPDATALGQIFWYTLEGKDKEGNTTSGWDLHELRSIQDFYVVYGLASAEGVAEVASIGGHVKEYQIDVDPEAMKVNNISLEQVMKAVKSSNIDIGAQTIEINLAEYFVRGLGYIKNIEDIEKSVIKSTNNVPLTIGDVAKVNIGPAARRGILDKSGAEAVGGVVVARYGANPMEVIQKVKEKIEEIAPGLPSKTLEDGTVSQVTIVPFYDRTHLINETIGTLEEALTLEILITIIVIILMLLNLKSSLLVAGTLPIAVLMCFVAMKQFGVDANIVALSGIAIAIGTMVDMGIVLVESILKRIEEAPPEEDLMTSIFEATTEVASAVITAVSTTVVSFLPVFTMEAAEGKLFRPLAYTKSFALVSSILVALVIIPPLAHSLFSLKSNKKIAQYGLNGLAILCGVFTIYSGYSFLGNLLIVVGLAGIITALAQQYASSPTVAVINWTTNIIYALLVTWLLASIWMPLGVEKSTLSNFFFVAIIAGVLIAFFHLLIYFYDKILRFLLRFKILFLVFVGFLIYQGFSVYKNTGEEFMPALNEGSFLLMPTSMPHAGVEENLKNLRLLDMAVTAIPEVETVVGKAGRVNSPLDPAPLSMYENVILYKTEYKTDNQGHRVRFAYKNGEYERDENSELIPDEDGRYFRQWRDHIQSPDDIWEEISKATQVPGLTSAPKLQPIETRLIMLQTGMRAPMGIKVRGSNLQEIESFGLVLEKELKNVEGVKDAAVFAERIVGKPYLLLDINRDAISRHGLTIEKVQQYIQTAIGGMVMTKTVEGRERYAVRIRYPRELRSDPDILKRIYIPTASGQQVLLGDLIDIRYEQGVQSIKSEDGFLVGYVLFDKEKGYSEVEVVHKAQAHLQTLIEDKVLEIPAGVNYRFAGNYEQQVRANERLNIVVPLALGLIFLILYFHFSSIMVSLMVFTGVFIAFSGGFIMLGLYDTEWFLNFDFFGKNMRDLFQIQTINLSVAVWVGFLALFGIATDDGVLVATFLQDSFKKNKPKTSSDIRDAVVEGGSRRVRPAMMTTATTVLALLPVLTSTGRGSDIMLPMAIPSFGGMALQMITMFTVPVLFCLWKEMGLKMDGFKNKNNSMKVFSIGFFLFFTNFLTLNGQSLDSLIRQAASENLEIKTLKNEYLAALERAPQVGELPEPEVGLGVFPFPVETRLGGQTLRLSAMQMLPWLGVRDSQKELENIKAKAVFERIEIQVLKIRYEVKKAYFELYDLRESQTRIKGKLVLFQSLERLALSMLESGKGAATDVLNIQLKLQELEQELLLKKEAETNPVVTINQLLNRPLDTPLSFDITLDFAEIPYNKTQLLSTISDNHPMLKELSIQQEVAQKRIELNTLNGKPSFGVGLDYILVSERKDAFPENNGRDILQLKATAKIPIFRQKYEAKEREENLNITVLENKKEALISQFLAKIEKAYSANNSSKLRLELYEKQKEIISANLRIIEASYSASGKGFEAFLKLEEDLINLDLKIIQAIVASHLALNEIELFVP